MTQKNLILAGFIVLKFLLQYTLVSPDYELHRDEFLHLDQAHHPAWGYLSVPPFTSWISSIIYFFGNTVFWIRFFPALFGALTMLVVWKAIEALKGNIFALILGAVAVLFSVLLRLNILYQPNSLDVLFWTTCYFILLKYIQSGKDKWILFAAIAFAFGFLNKYNIIFLLIGLLPGILLTEHRKIFTKKAFYASILLGLLLILPNLIWQYNRHFPVFHHLKELADTQLVNVSRWNFLKEQLLYFIGSLFVLLAATYALLFYPPFKKYRLFFWSLCFTLLVFTYLRAKGYYAIGIYPIYIAFGTVYLGEILQSGWKAYLRPIAIVIPLLFFIPMYEVVFPNKSPDHIIHNPKNYQALGLLRWEDGKDHPLPQDFADMLGWKELADKVDILYSGLADQEGTLILCDNYGQAGAINYYAKNKKIAAVSFNADYIDWFNLHQEYRHLIRIKNHHERDDELRETSPFFEKTEIKDSITNSFAREYGTIIFFFEKAKIDINKRIKEEIKEVKSYQ